MKTKAIVLAAALSLVVSSLVAMPSAANANGRFSFGFGIGGGPHPGFFFGPRIFFGPHIIRHSRPIFFASPCHNLRVKAEITGSRFWWRQYQICRLENSPY